MTERVGQLIELEADPAPIEEAAWSTRRLLETLAADRPLVVVFDDLHWAEPTFLDLVEQLDEGGQDAPVLLVAVARPELLEQRPAWAGGRPNAVTMLLEPLGPDESGALLDGLAASGTPPTLQALVAARLDRLDGRDRDVLERAAVVGQGFERDTVAELSPPEARAEVPERLRGLVRREFLRPAPALLAAEAGYQFRHLLVRDAVYAAVPKQVRAELHERLAGLLEAKAGARVREYEEIVGHHLEQAWRCLAELGPVDRRGRELGAQAAGRPGGWPRPGAGPWPAGHPGRHQPARPGPGPAARRRPAPRPPSQRPGREPGRGRRLRPRHRDPWRGHGGRRGRRRRRQPARPGGRRAAGDAAAHRARPALDAIQGEVQRAIEALEGPATTAAWPGPGACSATRASCAAASSGPRRRWPGRSTTPGGPGTSGSTPMPGACWRRPPSGARCRSARASTAAGGCWPTGPATGMWRAASCTCSAPLPPCRPFRPRPRPGRPGRRGRGDARPAAAGGHLEPVRGHGRVAGRPEAAEERLARGNRTLERMGETGRAPTWPPTSPTPWPSAAATAASGLPLYERKGNQVAAATVRARLGLAPPEAAAGDGHAG